MVKKLLLVFVVMLLPSNMMAETKQTLVINGENVEKEVNNLSFEGTDVKLFFTDGTNTLEDMNNVSISFEESNGIENLYAPRNSGIEDVSVYDLSGELLYRVGSINFDYSSLPSGMYILKEGNQTRKILKRFRDNYKGYLTHLEFSDFAQTRSLSEGYSDFSVDENHQYNQAILTYMGGVKYYNTKDVNNIEIEDDGAIIRLSNDITVSFGHLESIRFAKRQVGNILYVRKDGTGDFKDIQSAINSVTDATIDNQYEIRVCDDYQISDLTELYYVHTPNVHNNSPLSPSSSIAAVITKDYVNIVGYNRKHKIAVHSPYNLNGPSFQNVQTLWLQGNCIIDNIDFEIKNGRYAIHQESGGDTSSPDHNATTILRNVNAIHLGNSDSADGGASWKSICGQANGTCSGLTCIYENVTWTPSFYIHGNKNFESKNRFEFKNCSIIYDKDNPNVQGIYISSYGSGHNIEMECVGCNFYMMDVRGETSPDNTLEDACHDIRTFIPIVTGYANNNTAPITFNYAGKVLCFETQNDNVDVRVVGGTAMADIYGENIINFKGTKNAHGFTGGSEYIGYGAFLLGARLGDCTSCEKTLVITVDGIEQTIRFNDNFLNLSNEEVVSVINSQLSGAFATLSSKDNAMVMYPFKDCCEYGYNRTNETIFFGAPVIRDYSKSFGWKICPEGVKPEGIACGRIDPEEGGEIALIQKNYFKSIRDFWLTNGFAKVWSNNGFWSNADGSDDADLVSIGGGMWKSK